MQIQAQTPLDNETIWKDQYRVSQKKSTIRTKS